MLHELYDIYKSTMARLGFDIAEVAGMAEEAIWSKGYIRFTG